jgi:WD40 repeat protein
VKARDRYGVVPPPPHTQTLVHVECSLKHSLETHVDAVNAAVLLSRAQAVSASSDGTAVVWGLGAEEVGVQHVLAAGGGRVWAIAASEGVEGEGNLVASAHHDGSVRVWDSSSGALTATLDKSDGEIKALAFSRAPPPAPSGGRVGRGSLILAVGSTDRKLLLWRMISPCPEADIPADACRGGDGVQERPGGVEKVCGWVKVACLTGHSGTIVALAFAPVASAGCGEQPRMRLVSGSYDRTARVWEIGSQERGAKEVLGLRGHNHWVMSVSFSRCALRVCSGSYDRTVRIWNAISGEVLHAIDAHSDRVMSVDCVGWGGRGRGGGLVVSGSYDKTCKFWDLESGREVGCISSCHTGEVS